MKKILVVTAKYSADPTNPYLTNDLVKELGLQGWKVTLVGYGEKNVVRQNENYSEYIIRITSHLKILKYFFIWPKLLLTLLKITKTQASWDQIVMFGPLTVMWPAALFITYCKAPKKTAVIFDIFPLHQTNIGALPKVLNKPLKKIEQILLYPFTEITAMGENNKKIIETYYLTTLSRQQVKILPLWGRGLNGIKKTNNDETIRVVFGGQVSKGRELPILIDLFDELHRRGLPILFDIYSKGPYFEELKAGYSSKNWIHFKDQVPRKEYFECLSHYDVGAIVTDRNSQTPTFPSKIIDYIEANLQVYCLVEATSDLNSLAPYAGIHVNPFSFSEAELIRTLAFFNAVKKMPDAIQQEELKKIFSIQTAVKRLIA